MRAIKNGYSIKQEQEESFWCTSGLPLRSFHKLRDRRKLGHNVRREITCRHYLDRPDSVAHLGGGGGYYYGGPVIGSGIGGLLLIVLII
jgi:hypothetical protein